MRNIEASVICRLLSGNSADLDKFRDYKIDVDFFKTYNEQYAWLNTFRDKYGKLPSTGALRREYPEFPLHKTKEGIEYYCDKLVERETGIRLKDLGQRISPLLNAGRYTEALQQLKTATEYIDIAKTAKSVNWNTQNRYATAVKNRAQEIKTGKVYDTPFPRINKAIRYMRCQNLVTITGRLGFGKTWLLLVMALHLIKKYKVKLLLVSNEMSADEFMDRLDVIDARISWDRFLAGTLSLKHRNRYKRMLKRRKTYPGILQIIDDTTIDRKDVSGLVTEIDKFKPDAVFVDGVHQYDFKGSRDEVQKIMNLSRYMKRIAKARKVLLVQTAQQNRTAEGKKRGGGIAGVSWGDALMQDSDLAFEVVAPEGRESEVRVFSIIKGRNTGYTEVAVNLKLNPFTDISESGSKQTADLDKYFATLEKIPTNKKKGVE